VFSLIFEAPARLRCAFDALICDTSGYGAIRPDAPDDRYCTNVSGNTMVQSTQRRVVWSHALAHTFSSQRNDMNRSLFAAAAAAALITSTVGSTQAAPVAETVTVIADEPITNVPGKRLVSVIVDYLPGASSVGHHHAGSAFIYAYVLAGQIRSQVNDEPVRVYRQGDTWFEPPAAHHRVSENASGAEPARLLAVFIIDAADKQLTTAQPQ
jgi:quercetin dioxygenase-like cupin family protein